MKHLLNKILLLAAMLAVSTGFAHSAESTASLGGEADTVDVQHVMDAYHQAVVSHDGDRLAALFLPKASVWLNVLSDESYALARAKSPDAVKVRVGSVADFARLVSTAKSRFNPTHGQVQISSDGTIASVYFDFVFLIDGKAQNRGSEAWQLVKGSEGWRIAALTYSSNPVEP